MVLQSLFQQRSEGRNLPVGLQKWRESYGEKKKELRPVLHVTASALRQYCTVCFYFRFALLHVTTLCSLLNRAELIVTDGACSHCTTVTTPAVTACHSNNHLTYSDSVMLKTKVKAKGKEKIHYVFYSDVFA